MAPPKTDTDSRTRRRRGPLIAMLGVAVLGIGVLLFWVLEQAGSGPERGVGGVGPAEIRDGGTDPEPMAPDRTADPVDGDTAGPMEDVQQ